MAQCDFLTHKGWSGYYCLKKDDYLDNNTVNSYCDNSLKYRECPIYRGSSSSGGCYLTTACVVYKGLEDNCKELTVLRDFRDNYMANKDYGRQDIDEYYETAPRIVRAIDACSNAKDIYEKIYSDVIAPCVEMIEHGKCEDAYTKYKNMVIELKNKFCS